MRMTAPFRRILASAAALAVLLTLAAPPPHSLALSTDSEDSSTPQWVAAGGGAVWEADLTVGGDGDPLGYSESVGGSLTDTDFSWMETDYSVTGILLTQPDSDSSTATVSIRIEPGLPDEFSSLRLQVGDAGLNLADGKVGSGHFTWDGVDADWTTGAVVSLSLEEFPDNVALRALDGRGNNLTNLTWGMAGTTLLKKAPNSYADGVSTPTTSRPNARTISNLVFAQDTSVPNSSQASDIVWQWGQFLDHDITLSLDNAE